MEAVATRDDIARNFMFSTAVPISDARLRCVEVMHADIGGLEQDLSIRGQSRRDQILHHLVLAVDHHMFADEFRKIDAVIGAIEAHHHTRMQHALAPHAFADPGFVQQLLGAVFQHARTNAVLDVFARSRFQHNGLDTLQMQQMRQQQSGRTSPDDTNLRSHPVASFTGQCSRPACGVHNRGAIQPMRSRHGRSPTH